MQKLKLLQALLLIALPLSVMAQLKTYPLERSTGQTKKTESRSAKIKNTVTPLSLPFWDDFSFAVPETYPVDSLWIDNTRVLVSSGQAINPPNINVATFDGLDETGTPYSPSPTDILSFGYRDTLESQPIRMTQVAPVERGSVYFSFNYQAGGNGEPPDPKDFLRLEFKKSDGTWQSILVLTVDEVPDLTVFYTKIIQITDNIFYHDDFRFRFVSFGRKSGRFDAWHIDYVYLNKGRNATNNSFPDRSYYTKLSPLFQEYYSIPQSHFKNIASMGFSTFGLSNLEDSPQPMNYDLHSKIVAYENGVPSELEETIASAVPILPSIQAFEKRLIKLTTSPDLTPFITADSTFIQLTVALATDDSLNTGFEPINFFTNDTLRQSFVLKNYYAYDDGIADYSAGLVDSRNELACRFRMKTSSQDTINGLFINFPPFAGSAASSVDFFILNEIDGKPGKILYEESIEITQSANDQFSEHLFFAGVIVQGNFYVGYREPVTGSVRIGLDKSNDSGDQAYYRLSPTSQWQINDRVTGSLMIRPRFGFGPIYSNVPEEQRPVSIYPNPSNGEFNVKGEFDHLQIISTTGQPINATIENDEDSKRVRIATGPGLYIVQYKSGTKIYTEKILIK